MNWYTRLASGLIFPLHERLKGHDSVAIRRGQENSQWQSADQLRAIRLRGLQRLLREAYDKTDYYRRVMGELGLAPEDFQSLEDLQRLPFLTKPLIRAHTEELKARDAVGLARFNTGGSTGEPLVFFIGKERVSHDVAAKWRATRWWDCDIGDPEIVVWGSPVELTTQDRVKEWRDKLLRTRLIPAFEMSPENLDAFIAQIRAFRPKMLFGYPSSLALIAKRARERGIAMDDLGISTAFVTAERLYDEQRQIIAATYGCRVANGYGGRDAGFIAHECPHGGMHITAEDIIVEIIDRDGKVLPPGEVGEVVVTHLATRDYPFIRYRTGDVASLSTETCACGRGLPMLAELQGRTTDFIVAADGTIMHGLALIYVVRDLECFESFKILQESKQLTRLLAIPGPNYGPELAQDIIAGFKQRLGDTVEIEIELVNEIPRTQAGKFRYVESRVGV